MGETSDIYFSGMTPDESRRALDNQAPLRCYFCKRQSGAQSLRIIGQRESPEVQQVVVALRVGEYTLTRGETAIRFHLGEECDAIISLVRGGDPPIGLDLSTISLC